METLSKPISIAIETTCRAGGVALGGGDALVEALEFDAARRAATQTVARLDELVKRNNLTPADVEEIYVASGPGSFTGTRVGITVARTLAQTVKARCVGVPTVLAVAEHIQPLAEVQRLAVVLDARHGRIWWALFERRNGWLEQTSPGTLATPEEMLARAPRPLHLVGEGLGFYALAGADIIALPEPLWLPRVSSVWSAGRRLAQAGQFTDYHQLLPIYTGKPEAVRVWDAKHGQT